MAEPQIVTAATVTPVSVHEFKQWSSVDYDDSDSVVEDVLAAAVQIFESATGRTLHQTTWEIYLDGWPCNYIELPRSTPLISVVEIAYKNTLGVETLWTDFATSRRTTKPARIKPASGMTWPSFQPYPLDPIRVQYRSGIENGSPQTFPGGGIRVAVKAIAASLFEIREAETITNLGAVQVEQLSLHARALIYANKVEW